ncbi:PilW family protein [Lyngbya confervoides]|uniref:Prepilin-type N-terminal cleavage/methylation domain-containing protein n=1 Tax=Lyngbya confervoides BDU141951 TaxID=1574623 RepID=A0ABD4T307_9CYAN|nr:prepilin-type N-terminal cleavage/methylation domain-containing protein [Lyngbya confervoides]MCM1983073.1 prepilin-type N-terminal cleavage/methylation domain-containing protein [Lyngbya confervoides BDU141951]
MLRIWHRQGHPNLGVNPLGPKPGQAAPFPRESPQAKVQIGPAGNQGFSLVEVMVSMIITLSFLMITLQIFLSAAYLRARSTEYNETYNWIQEDFEQVLTKAKAYQVQVKPYSSQCGAANPDNGLAAGFIADSADGLGGSSATLGTRTYGGKNLELRRTASYNDTLDPNRLIKLQYAIVPPGGSPPVLELETKVVIYAAFNCP